MLKRSITWTLVFVFSIALAFVGASFAGPVATPLPTTHPSPQKADCSKATDADIVKAVVDNIKKKFTPEQIKAELHLNITCKNGVVELAGDAHGINRKDPREVRTRITTIAQKTECVKKVDTRQLTHEHPVKCTKTQKQCNGGCIDQNSECNPL